MISFRFWASLIYCLLVLSCKLHKPKNPVSAEIPESVKELYYLGESAYLAGNKTEARTHFTDFVKNSPQPAAGMYRLACLDKAEGNNQEALAWIIKAQKGDTGNYYYTLFEADLHQKTRQYGQAANIYHHLALKYPSHYSFFADAAKMYRYASQADLLIKLCLDWEKAFGLREEMMNYKVESHFQLRQFDEGLNEWQRLMKKYPYRRQYKLTLASWYTKAGKTDEAARLYQELLKEDPGNPELLSTLCEYYVNSGNLEGLWEHAKKVVKSPQMDVWKKHSCLVPFLNNLGDNKYYDSLEQPLVTLTQLHGTDHRSWLFLADWYYARKQYLPAINGFSRSLNLFTNDYQVWAKYTECLDRTAAYAHLVLVADSMLEIFPSHPMVELIAAAGNLGAENWVKAREHCQNGLVYAVDEDVIVALKTTLARVLTSESHKEEAFKLLESLIKEYPQNTEVMNELARFYAVHKENKDQAKIWINKAMTQTLKPEYLFTNGLIEFQWENWQAAIASLNQAIETDPHGKYLMLLGDAHLQAGDKNAAQSAWKKAWDGGFRPSVLQDKIHNSTNP